MKCMGNFLLGAECVCLIFTAQFNALGKPFFWVIRRFSLEVILHSYCSSASKWQLVQDKKSSF